MPAISPPSCRWLPDTNGREPRHTCALASDQHERTIAIATDAVATRLMEALLGCSTSALSRHAQRPCAAWLRPAPGQLIAFQLRIKDAANRGHHDRHARAADDDGGHGRLAIPLVQTDH